MPVLVKISETESVLKHTVSDEKEHFARSLGYYNWNHYQLWLNEAERLYTYLYPLEFTTLKTGESPTNKEKKQNG